MKVFFNYSIDCELPANTEYTAGREREAFFHGPVSWDAAQESVEGFVEQMCKMGVQAGASLFVYPDVARHQRALFRKMNEAGIEIALHLNGLRYSRLAGDRTKWLGCMSRQEQKEALRLGKTDIEDAIGVACLGYRACYGSANFDTMSICEELGFKWSSNSSGRYRPEFFANWSGSWPFPHHASRHNNLICGDLNLFEIPITVGLHVYYDEAIRQPLDLRVETPSSVLGEDRSRLRAVIEENLIEMERRSAPVRAVVGASHNTNPFGDLNTHQAQNLDWVVRHSRDLARQYRLEFTPAHFATVCDEAVKVGAY